MVFAWHLDCPKHADDSAIEQHPLGDPETVQRNRSPRLPQEDEGRAHRGQS